MAKSKKVKIKRAEPKPVTDFLSTGCTILDLAVSNRPGKKNGLPCGRVTHIYGWESSAKTVLAQEPLGDSQRNGGLVWYLDVEQTLDLQRASSLFGLVTTDPSFHYAVPTTIEDLFDVHIVNAMDEIIELGWEDKPNVLALDSLSALSSEAELATTLTKGTYGLTRAKQISTAYRKYLKPLNDINLALVMVNQARTNIAAMFGDKMTVSGGKAIDFYASTSIAMTNVGQIKNENKVVIGSKFKFKVTKNKIAAPHKQGTFFLLYDYGIDNIRTNLQWLRDIRNEKGNYKFKDLAYKSAIDMIKAIEDGDLEKELEKEVEIEWQSYYAVEKRKEKNRVILEKSND